MNLELMICTSLLRNYIRAICLKNCKDIAPLLPQQIAHELNHQVNSNNKHILNFIRISLSKSKKIHLKNNHELSTTNYVIVTLVSNFLYITINP